MGYTTGFLNRISETRGVLISSPYIEKASTPLPLLKKESAANRVPYIVFPPGIVKFMTETQHFPKRINKLHGSVKCSLESNYNSKEY